MKTPMIVVNFKTYKQATGRAAVDLALVCNKVAKQYGTQIIVCVQPTDIHPVCAAVTIPVFAQHVDPIEYGKNTGYLLPQAAKDAGASGTLLNHAEHKMPPKLLAEAVRICAKIGLTTLVCAMDAEEASRVARLDPHLIAIELPELIGTGISVSTASPDVVTSSIEAVRKIKSIPVLCGAGITTAKDIHKAIELGARGVLLASGITESPKPYDVLVKLAQAV